MRPWPGFAAFAVLLALVPDLTSQPRRTMLTGRVVDRAGAALSGARVETSPPTASGPVLSDSRGRFSLQIPARFELLVSREGFRSVRSEPVAVSGDAYEVVIPLLEGDPGDVERVAMELEETRSLVGRIDPTAREGLPRSDRLFGLKGGVNVSGIAEGTGQQWIASSGSVFTSSSIAAAEGTTIDFSADLGSAAVEDDALPAGQDEFQGSAYYFHRNDQVNARNFFDRPGEPIPPFKYHFLGADSGGRLDDRTYWYAQFWSLRIRQSITRAATVPDPAWIRGDFSALGSLLLDPETTLPFPGNRIPAARISTRGLELARLFPSPNVSGTSIQNFRSVAQLTTSADAFGFRFDRRWRAADEAFFEYQFSRDTTVDPFNLVSGITNLPLFGVRDALQTHTVRVNNTHVFSAALVHQSRLGVSLLSQPRSILGSGRVPAVLLTGISNLGHATNLPQFRRSRSVEVVQDVSWQRARSRFRAGGQWRYFPVKASMDLYGLGQFQFTGGVFSGHPVANLLLGLPTNALRITGDTLRDFRTQSWSFFGQSDFALRPSLSLSFGLRYDYQTPVAETARRAANFDVATGTLQTSPQMLYRRDLNNWGPRVGIAASLGGAVVRAGYGVFYDPLSVGDSLFLLGLNPPFVDYELENNGPIVPLFTLDTVFRTDQFTSPPSIFSAAADLANPYLQQWNLSLERETGGWIAGAGYSGRKGTRLRRQVNVNQPSPGPLVAIDERRPYPFQNIFQFETSASSVGHALDMRVERPFANRAAVRAEYRWSKSIDDATLISILPQDSLNLAAERGLSDFDVRHRLAWSGTLNLPGVLRGWQIQVLGTAQSGTPLSAILGSDVAGTGSPIVNRPDMIRNPSVSRPTPSRFFDPLAFVIPQPGRFGNSGRNVIAGPGLVNLDLSLTRVLRLSDALRAHLRLDAFNVTNHPNFVPPPSLQNFADAADFGSLFVARSPRILQFGVKFVR